MNLRDRTVVAVLALTAVSVVLRLVGLGGRVTHWDEGRVAYWVLEYGQTGVLFYRPIVHGPLLKLVNAPVVELLGATDFAVRLFPALVGGLLPLVALAFRHRLRDVGAVALAAFLALDPTLLYYSRFMRNDILVAAFCFVAIAAVVRAIDFDDGRYLPVATVALAFAFGAKENALAYVFAFVGAGGLLVIHRLAFAWYEGHSPVSRLRELSRWGYDGIRRHVRATTGATVAFLVTITYLYAPRGSIPSEDTYYASCSGYEPIVGIEAAPTLGEAIMNPLLLPRLAWFTVGSTAELYACQWITPRTDDPNPYIEFLTEMGTIAGEASGVLLALAVLGFAVTLYRPGMPDDLVSFAFYWGAASMVGYPFITDIGGASWLAVHIVLPLAIPAAVGAGLLYDVGRDAWAEADVVSVAIAVGLCVLLLSSMLWVGYTTSAVEPTDDGNPLVQYAQPSGELAGTLSDTRSLVDRNDGTDILIAGDELTGTAGGGDLDRRPACADWYGILPLPWYFEAGGIDADCAPDASALDDALDDEPPVVVVDEADAELVDERIDDRYDRRVHSMRTTGMPFVYYVDESRLD